MTYHNQVIEKLTGIRDNTSGISSLTNQSDILNNISTIDGIVDSVLVNTSNIYQSNSTIDGIVDTILTNTSHLREELCHCTTVFPEDVDDYIRLTTGATNKSFGAWTSVVSNKNVTFSANCNESCCHITGFLVEAAESATMRYIVELSQGPNHSCIVQQRFYTDAANKPTVQQSRIASCCCNTSEDVWMRAKSVTGSKWLDFSLRFHYH